VILSTTLAGYKDAVVSVRSVTWIQRRRLFCPLSYLDTKTPSVLSAQLPGYKDAVCFVRSVTWIQRRLSSVHSVTVPEYKVASLLSTQLPGYKDALPGYKDGFCSVHSVTWIQRRRLFCPLSYLDTKTPSVLSTQLPGCKDAVCSVHSVTWIHRRLSSVPSITWIQRSRLFCPLSYLDTKTPSVLSTPLPSLM
jgi:hypothetical protein